MRRSKHVHQFERCYLVPMKVVGQTVTAWVPERAVWNVSRSMRAPDPNAWLCRCGEQGYMIREAR